MSDANPLGRLLIVDDQVEFGEFMAKVGRSAGFEVVLTERVDDFLVQFEEFRPTSLIIDIVMPVIDGPGLLRELSRRGCSAAIWLTSGMDAGTLSWAQTWAGTLGLHVAGLIAKPIRAADLRAKLIEGGIAAPLAAGTG
jgi:DNA-binding response OmpR family regulator